MASFFAPSALRSAISFFFSSTTMMSVAMTVHAAMTMMSPRTKLIPICWKSSAVKRPWFELPPRHRVVDAVVQPLR